MHAMQEGTAGASARGGGGGGDAAAPAVVIIGSGPCGLGAAHRLQELGHARWRVLEKEAAAGGLAASVVDAQGFTWDMGGHVVFSHYQYFDQVLDACVQDWCSHERSAWVWMRDRWIPYPFQNNIHRLPEEECVKCMDGLLDNEATKGSGGGSKPTNFHEWLDRGFGSGIMETFLTPYNKKVWGYDPEEMNVEWMGERVAPINIKTIVHNIIRKTDSLSWGPNATFRFPLRGGTGAIWEALAAKVPAERYTFDADVVSIDTDSRVITTASGSTVPYDKIISTMPLDVLLSRIHGQGTEDLADAAQHFRYSSTHVVGIGLNGTTPSHLGDKCWMYFPEDDCPFYRVTVFSNYAPYHVPKPGQQWSLMCEICESRNRPVDIDTIVQETIDGLVNTRLITREDKQHHIASTFHTRLHYGYPTPFVGRDQLCAPIFRRLEEMGIYSRGRFGAWKYEISNQDHTMMQGVECVDHILFGTEESTFHFPGVVNGRNWKPVSRTMRTPPPRVFYADRHAIIAEHLRRAGADVDGTGPASPESRDASPEAGSESSSSGSRSDSTARERQPRQTILVSFLNVIANCDDQLASVMAEQHPGVDVVPAAGGRHTHEGSIEAHYDENAAVLIKGVVGSAGFVRNLPPVSGALRALRAMRDAGHEVYIVVRPVTDNSVWMIQHLAESLEWIEEHLGASWRSRIIVANNTMRLRGGIFIDDRDPIAGIESLSGVLDAERSAASEHGPESKTHEAHKSHAPWHRVVLDRPYNREISDLPRMPAWDQWRNLVGAIAQAAVHAAHARQRTRSRHHNHHHASQEQSGAATEQKQQK